MKSLAKAFSFKVLMAAVVLVPFGASFAHAKEQMSCLVSVYKGEDFNAPENTDLAAKTTKVVDVELKAGEGDQEFQINGETVGVTLWKYEHTDLYQFNVALMTPVADRDPRGPAAISYLTDFLYNDGPTKNSGWDLNPGPGHTRYAYLNRQSGSFSMTRKLVNALKAEGQWGTHPFTSSLLDVNYSHNVAEFVKDQIQKKKLQESDVLAISTVFSCTHQN